MTWTDNSTSCKVSIDGESCKLFKWARSGVGDASNVDYALQAPKVHFPVRLLTRWCEDRFVIEDLQGSRYSSPLHNRGFGTLLVNIALADMQGSPRSSAPIVGRLSTQGDRECAEYALDPTPFWSFHRMPAAPSDIDRMAADLHARRRRFWSHFGLTPDAEDRFSCPAHAARLHLIGGWTRDQIASLVEQLGPGVGAPNAPTVNNPTPTF